MVGEPESLDLEEPLERRRHRHWFDRVIMLSDGVFAIAITLLAFDLRAPPDWRTLGDLWSSLVPQLDAYALSFLVVAVYWLAHRRFMAMITTADAPLTVLNLVLLALVALIPAATRVAHDGPVEAGMLVYSGLVVAIGLMLAAIWGYASLVAGYVPREVTIRARWHQFVLMIVTPGLFLALVAWIPEPPPGLVPLLLLALFLIGWRMRLWALARLDRRPPPRGSENHAAEV
jgi:uncharacterized membrane protein